MSQQPINIHRSFAGLLVGNIVAIFVSGLVCILVWSSLFPDFYAQLRQHIKDTKNARQIEQKGVPEKKTDKDEKENRGKKNKTNENPKEADAKEVDAKMGDSDDAEKPEVTPLPEFSLAIWATTLAIDLFFAALAGFLCVLIAGFARNNHAILMALFLLVWKVQQLIGFVENQVPPTLVLAEVIGLPIACVVGAALFFPDEGEANKDDDSQDSLAENSDQV